MGAKLTSGARGLNGKSFAFGTAPSRTARAATVYRDAPTPAALRLRASSTSSGLCVVKSAQLSVWGCSAGLTSEAGNALDLTSAVAVPAVSQRMRRRDQNEFMSIPPTLQGATRV